MEHEVIWIREHPQGQLHTSIRGNTVKGFIVGEAYDSGPVIPCIRPAEGERIHWDSICTGQSDSFIIYDDTRFQFWAGNRRGHKALLTHPEYTDDLAEAKRLPTLKRAVNMARKLHANAYRLTGWQVYRYTDDRIWD